jgi:hypothetical protein
MSHTFHSDIVNNDIASTTLSNKNDMNWTWSNTATYNFTLAQKHDFQVLLGAEMSKQSSIDWSGYNEGYALEDPDYMWPNAATGTARVTGARVGYRLASFFGKVDYNFDDFILASFTIRHDGSSRFGKDHRWGTFPAATLGVRLSKLIKADWLDDWKVRASWGKTGNQAIDNNAQSRPCHFDSIRPSLARLWHIPIRLSRHPAAKSQPEMGGRHTIQHRYRLHSFPQFVVWFYRLVHQGC